VTGVALDDERGPGVVALVGRGWFTWSRRSEMTRGFFSSAMSMIRPAPTGLAGL
jgi:hypothetical protein